MFSTKEIILFVAVLSCVAVYVHCKDTTLKTDTVVYLNKGDTVTLQCTEGENPKKFEYSATDGTRTEGEELQLSGGTFTCSQDFIDKTEKVEAGNTKDKGGKKYVIVTPEFQCKDAPNAQIACIQKSQVNSASSFTHPHASVLMSIAASVGIAFISLVAFA